MVGTEMEVYKFFCDLCKIPHGSGNEKAISDYLAAFAKENHLDAVQDKWMNVLIRKPGTKGRENEPPVILQAHMDMVCEKNDDVKHNFLSDPIIPFIDGDIVRAKGTTLGADDGFGLALIMTILAAGNLSHPPIEALITTEEELGCSGAANFDVSLLNGKRLINLDGGDEDLFVAGCAGGAVIDIEIPVEYDNAAEADALYKLMVKGLTGGHSGVDIDKGRGNANILMAQILDKLFEEGIYLVNINGGSKMNAIPRECSAVICFAESRFEKIKSVTAQTEALFKTGYPHDPDLGITLSKTGASGPVIRRSSLRKIIDTILKIPSGVLALSPDMKSVNPDNVSGSWERLVQTSNNPGVVTCVNDKVVLNNFLRSSSYADMDLVLEKMKMLADSYGAAMNITERFPAWEYRADSPLRDKMIATFKEIYGKDPVVTSVHGGLECAVFAQKMPDGDFAAAGGPAIIGAHSPDEQMSLSALNRVYNFLVRVLEKP